MNENKHVKEIKHMQGWNIQNKIYLAYIWKTNRVIFYFMLILNALIKH